MISVNERAAFMSKSFWVAFAIGIALVAGVIGYTLFAVRGQHLDPSGAFLQIRTAALDEAHSALIVDFEVNNASDRVMTIRFLNLAIHTKDGNAPDASPIAASDLPTLFRYHKELGGIEHAPMKERDVIDPHRTARGTVAARFDIPESDLKARKDLTLSIEDVTGAKLEITAK